MNSNQNTGGVKVVQAQAHPLDESPRTNLAAAMLAAERNTAGQQMPADSSQETFTSSDVPESSVDPFDFDIGQKDNDFAVVEIFKPECLSCGHLVPFVEHKYKKCHFSKGNEFCPAQSLQLQVRVPAEEVARKFLAAERVGDTAAMGRFYSKLAEKPEWAQRRIMETIKSLRES